MSPPAALPTVLSILIVAATLIAVGYSVARYVTLSRKLNAVVDAKDRLSLEVGLHDILLKSLGAAVLLLGVLFTSLQATQARSQLEQAQRSQLSDWFGRAAQQVSSVDPATRLGGVYTLQQLESDTAYRLPVQQLLAALIRDRSSAVQYRAARSGSAWPSSDVLAALVVLGRGPCRGKDALLQDEQHHDVHDRIWVGPIVLRRARLDRLEVASLDMEGAALDSASMVSTHACNAGLRRATLVNAVLSDTDLSGADLRLADLRNAVLSRADLTFANLSGADLRGASMILTNLERADLRGANLSGVTGLTQKDIEVADGDMNTRIPMYLKPPDGWR